MNTTKSINQLTNKVVDTLASRVGDYTIYNDGIIAKIEDIDDVEVGELFIVNNRLYKAIENEDYIDMDRDELSLYELKLKLTILSAPKFTVTVDLDEDGECEFDEVSFNLQNGKPAHQIPTFFYNEEDGIDFDEGVREYFDSQYLFKKATTLFTVVAESLLAKARK